MDAWRSFETASRRIREAIKAGTFDAGENWHFTLTPLLLDRIGWQKVVAGIDGLSRHVAAEQAAAEARLAQSGQEPFPVTVVQAAFESPLGPDGARLPDGERQLDPGAVPPATTKVPPPSSPKTQALVSPLRLAIVAAAGNRDLSPAVFAEERGGASSLEMSHHFEALRKQGWLNLVDTQAGKGSSELEQRRYRLSVAPVFETDLCVALPGSLRAVVITATFESYAWHVREAMEAGTLEAREGWRHSCTPLQLDRLGWEGLIARTDVLFEFLLAEQDRATRRLAESDEEPFAATVALTVFQSPGGPAKPPRFLGHLRQAAPR